MTINFNEVAQSVRASNLFIEMAGQRRSFAGLFISPKVGLIGCYDPAKTAVVDYEPVKVSSKEKVGELFGFGSHIHRQALAMPDAVFDSCEVYAFPVPDNASAVDATETITFTGASTSAGTLYFSIGGVLVSVAVASGADVATIAAALVSAITAKRDIAVTAANTSGVVTLTAKTSGTPGNEILVVQNPSGDVQEADAPSGVTVAIENSDGYLDGGTGAPDIEDVFFNADGTDKLGDRWYTIFTCPFTDSTNLGYIEAAGDMRAAAGVHRHFGAYAAYVQKTYDEALAIPATINKKWIGDVWDSRCYAPAFEFGAALVGRIAYEQLLAPNRPYKQTSVGLACDGSQGDLGSAKLDALFRAGMGYCTVSSDGTMYFGDIPLTYRTTPLGAATEEWFDAVSLHLKQAKAYSIEQLFISEPYTRGVVVDDEAVTAYEWAISPKTIIADMAKLIDELWARFAWTKNAEKVIEGLTAEINEANNSRIDAQVTDDPAQALRIIAMKYAFLY
ncbi:MAG: hypothetical protein CVV44_03855 [Spirochaetae bacterium HGW-Spirochaetae-1]|jgi:phage tail sheath gpL-like|nr:MAG: hypothetical protein CVV44_03855 [Spirochaetae bacterium HGW-Spirochaetae-1]